MPNHEAKPYPLDFEALHKGSVIETETLEDLFHIDRAHRRFPLLATQLRDRIHKELAKLGRPATVAFERDRLRVLTDQEASDYNAADFAGYQRRATRAHVRMLNVDRAQLSSAERNKHDQKCIVHGAMLSAMRTAKRLALQPTKDERPSMLPPKTTE